MNRLPYESRAFLEKTSDSMPRTPYNGALAIATFIHKNYFYGCDENITQESWVRLPHQIRKYMNCQDSGIFGFLMARQLGLESYLLRLEDFEGTGQSHLGTLIIGSKDYMLSNDTLETVRFKDNHLICAEDNPNYSSEDKKSTFSKMSILTVPDILHWVEESKGPGGATRFFETGQSLGSYYDKATSELKMVYKVNRHLRVQDGYLMIRKDFTLPSVCMHVERHPNNVEMYVSLGYNNIKMHSPYSFMSAVGRELKFVHHSRSLPEKVQKGFHNALIRSHAAGHFSYEKAIKQARKVIKKPHAKGNEGFSPIHGVRQGVLHEEFSCLQGVAEGLRNPDFYRKLNRMYKGYYPEFTEFAESIILSLQKRERSSPIPRKKGVLLKRLEKILSREGIEHPTY